MCLSLYWPAGQIKPRTLAVGYRETTPSIPSSLEQSEVSIKKETVCYFLIVYMLFVSMWVSSQCKKHFGLTLKNFFK